MPLRNRRVVALLYDGLCTFEFSIAVEVFALARPELGVKRWYRFETCSLGRGPARATGGVRIACSRGLSGLRGAGTIIIPGWRGPDAVPPAALLRILRQEHARGARLVSICSGVFVLAAAGLLDGHRATTHWRYAEMLQKRYPRIRVQPDVLYVDEGSIATSAGSAAGIDLCLHLVRRDFGAQVANEVARRMVVPPHRDGGQAQFIPAPLPERPDHALAGVLDWAASHLQGDLRVPRLAQRAGMSVRSFARHFFAQTGTTPHDWVVQQRLLAAQRLLETTGQSIDQVASSSGFDSPESLRHHFRRILRTTPSAYRRQFSVAGRRGFPLALRARPEAAPSSSRSR